MTTTIVIGPVLTGDPARPDAEAFATRDGVVLAVGGTQEVTAAAGPGARIVRHDGLAMPGLIDSHLHFQRAGLRAVQHLAPDAGLDEYLDMCARTMLDEDWREGEEPTADERLDALRRVQRYAAALGIVGVIDPAVTLDEWWGYRASHARGELVTRVVAMPWIPIADGTGPAAERVLAGLDDFGGVTGDGDDTLRLGGTKLYLDGEGMLGQAWLERPWSPDGYRGLRRMEPDDLERLVAAASRRGWGVGCHAVGSAAVAMALDAFERAADAGIDVPSLRCQLIHAYLEPSGETMRRAAALGVIASLQPSIVWNNMGGLAERLGERAHTANPVRSWLDAGATVAFGSDGPYFPFDPRLLLDQAVARIAASSPHAPVGPGEAIGPSEGLHAYTAAGAHASFATGRRGVLAEGALADWTLLSGDPRAVPGRARSIEVLRTAVGGVELHAPDTDLVDVTPAT